MPYGIDELQSSIRNLADAGEAGRRSLDGMLGPVNGAIGDIYGAVGQLQDLPFLGPEVGGKLQRLIRAVSAAQAKANAVLNLYSQAARALAGIDERMAMLREQASWAGAAINRIAGRLEPSLANLLPTGALTGGGTPAAEAVAPFPHLLVLQPLKPGAAPYFFNLDTAAFDSLQRQTSFRWASQERLSRRPALQAVGQGDDKLTLKGAVFPLFRGGIGQLEALRSIGTQLLPVNLTTGYGNVLGSWCLLKVDEDQGALLQGGVPRKQSFTLEFSRYGDDLSNVNR